MIFAALRTVVAFIRDVLAGFELVLELYGDITDGV